MAAVTICNDFGAQENKICHCFHFFPFYLPWNDWTRCHDLAFWMLSFKSAFSLSSFTFVRRLVSSSSFPAIKVVSSAYLRPIFLLAFLIPTCESSSPTFHMMCSTYKLNKQNDNMQPWHTTFPILNQSIVPCPVLTVASCLAYRFLRRQVMCFNVVNEGEVDVFLKFSCLFYDPAYFGNLISGSSAFSKSSLYNWKFSVYVPMKPSLKDFEYNFSSIWHECNCGII